MRRISRHLLLPVGSYSEKYSRKRRFSDGFRWYFSIKFMRGSKNFTRLSGITGHTHLLDTKSSLSADRKRGSIGQQASMLKKLRCLENKQHVLNLWLPIYDPSVWDTWGSGRAHLVVRPCIPISSLLTHMVYISNRLAAISKGDFSTPSPRFGG